MLKRLLISWLSLALLLTLLPAAASAAKGTVQVKIANFPVRVNGQLINNQLSKYPFIVYKDITYVPLNDEMVRELEIISKRNKSTGLQLYRVCCASSYWEYPALKKKPYVQDLSMKNSASSTYTANIASYKIRLWEGQIKNNEITYPFLEFRNVTYMPLTWENAHTLFMMDLQWSKKDGLAIWSGQDRVMYQIVYDDDTALYLDATGVNYKTRNMLKIAKSFKASPLWLDKEQAKAVHDKADQATHAKANEGQKVSIELINNVLMYQGLELGKLTESEISNKTETFQIRGILYDIDEKRKLLTVETSNPAPFAHIGLDPSRNQLFTIIDGRISKITEYSNGYLPPQVLKNADGTVWFARDRVSAVNDGYIPGSGFLAIMDQEGNVRVANDAWNELDVSPIGINDPTADFAHMVVRLYGKPKLDLNGKTVYDSGFKDSYLPEKDALYSVDTALQLKRISSAPDSKDGLIMYKDKQGEIYSVNVYSNTLTNWTQNNYRTWTDLELLKDS